MTTRTELRQLANKPECDGCEFAANERHRLAGQVDEGDLTLDEALDRYNSIVSSCRGLISTVVRVVDTKEGQRRLDVIRAWRSDPVMSQFSSSVERLVYLTSETATLCTNTDRPVAND